jgi:L-fucose mutarotase
MRRLREHVGCRASWARGDGAVLKNIDPLLNPDLLYALAAMGHGDELAIVDRNYPAASTARRLIRLDGASTVEAVRAVLSLLPLDTFVAAGVIRMEVVDDPALVPDVQAEVLAGASAIEGRELQFGSLERYAFYERSRSAFATVLTGESRPYGCVLLVKGVVPA